jgi:16S rRNA (cytidine1402-2'-O)-methyltransferase
MPGTLFVVATPIGNLEDLTFRALRTLKEVDRIAAEDTRRTARLLGHYGVSKPMTSYREHNEARETPRLLERLAAGESIALVTDAGTPGIADPGARLVRAALLAGYPVVPVPGPSAVVAALSASGLAEDRFLFAGFPPASGQARAKWLTATMAEPGPVVLFEAPHRIRRLMEELRMVERPIFVAREITKIHEIFVHVTDHKAMPLFVERGEFVVVLGARPESSDLSDLDVELADRMVSALEAAGFERRQTLDLVARALDSDASTVKRSIKKARILVKQHNRSGQ